MWNWIKYYCTPVGDMQSIRHEQGVTLCYHNSVDINVSTEMNYGYLPEETTTENLIFIYVFGFHHDVVVCCLTTP